MLGVDVRVSQEQRIADHSDEVVSGHVDEFGVVDSSIVDLEISELPRQGENRAIMSHSQERCKDPTKPDPVLAV